MSARRWVNAVVALSLLATGARAQDDLVPAKIEALVSAPEDSFFFGIAFGAGAKLTANTAPGGNVRCLIEVGDASGDGVADLALGLGPGSEGHALQVRDGQAGTLLWTARPGDGSFRSFRALAAHEGRLAAGFSSARGRVECRAILDGSLLWSRDLAPRSRRDPANIQCVDWFEDIDRDGTTDLLVAAGRGLDGLWLLSGADGSDLWHVAAGDVVYAVTQLTDLDDDGVPDVVAVGGDQTPLAEARSGQDGELIWSRALAGPGSAVALLHDVNGNGTPDVAVGLFAEPQVCFVALDGATGALLWETNDVRRNVTTIAFLSDLDFDGHADLTVGSFDEAVPSILSSTGGVSWRTTLSTNNTGAPLSVTTVGDLDGNGFVEVLTASLDHRSYLIDGRQGFMMMVEDLRARGFAVTSLADADGDGRRELVAAGENVLRVMRSSSGTADGPVLSFEFNEQGQPTLLEVFAYPSEMLLVLGALDTDSVHLPGFSGLLGLDLSAFGVLYFGPTPGAQPMNFEFPPLPRALAGATIYFQAVTVVDPGQGLFSSVLPFHVPDGP
ncbi:MAG: outer membrane protein assembly factor BamB family protein [Planctomycetota bacterium]